MYKLYRGISRRYPKISLQEELSCGINKKTVSGYRKRFGDGLLSEALFVLGAKIKSYNLPYKDKEGNPRPVRFISYIWKRIDGFIVDYLRRELEKDRLEECLYS